MRRTAVRSGIEFAGVVEEINQLAIELCEVVHDLPPFTVDEWQASRRCSASAGLSMVLIHTAGTNRINCLYHLFYVHAGPAYIRISLTWP